MNPIIILNTLAASGGDLSLVGRELTISESGSVVSPSIKYPLIKDSGQGLLKSLVEQVSIKTVTYTPANNTTYEFTVTQVIDEKLVLVPVKFISDASGTEAEIDAGIINSFNQSTFSNNGQQIQVVASDGSGAGEIDFTANAGFPLFDITAVQNVTVADAQPTTDVTGGITNATPRVVTATAHGLATGQTVNISGATGAGAADVNKSHRITFIDANSYSLDGTSNTGTVSVGSATAFLVAQESRGSATDVSDFIANKADITGTVNSANAYAQLTLDYGVDAIPLNLQGRTIDGFKLDLFVASHILANPYTPISNFAGFETRINEILNALAAGTTDADPEAVSVD